MAGFTVSVVGSVTVIGVFAVATVSYASPAKLDVTVSAVCGWSTVGTVQLTFPFSSVVPLQDCAVVPEPMVKVTTLVGSGVPEVGVSVVSVPESVVGDPLTAVVAPVYVSALVSGLTVKVLVELFEPIGVDVVVSPGKDAVSV